MKVIKNSSSVALSLLLCLSGSAFAEAEQSGTINFQSDFITSLCTVSVTSDKDGTNQIITGDDSTLSASVTMGSVYLPGFADETYQNWTSFTVAYSGCPDNALSMGYTFTGPVSTDTTAFEIGNTDNQSLIGLVISTTSDESGLITPYASFADAEASDGVIGISGTEGSQEYYAAYKAIATGAAAGTEGSDVTPITLTFTY